MPYFYWGPPGRRSLAAWTDAEAMATALALVRRGHPEVPPEAVQFDPWQLLPTRERVAYLRCRAIHATEPLAAVIDAPREPERRAWPERRLGWAEPDAQGPDGRDST